MEDVVREPVELTDADLDQVVGGWHHRHNTAECENIAAVILEQVVDNLGSVGVFLNGVGNVGLQALVLLS
jgi:hypothetical protein